MRLTFPALALAAVLGCAGPRQDPAPRVVPAGWRLQHEDGVRPTLAEIFLETPPWGEPPRLLGASADARYAVLAWSDPGRAADEAERTTLRLLAADGSPPTPAGRPLAELLPPAEPDGPTELAWAWSHAGRRLALARGTTVWMVDPGRASATMFARWEPPPELRLPADPPGGGEARAEAERGEESVEARTEEPRAEQDTPAAGAEDEAREPRDEPAPVLALGRVRTLAFRDDDGALRVGDGLELVELPLAGGHRAAPLGLDDATWLSRDVDSPAERLTWSDDAKVAFGADPLPRPERSPGYQVWLVDEEREIALEGWEESAGLERASLSPDGRWLVALELDRSDEPAPVEIPDYLSERVTHRAGRTRLADDREGTARVWAWNVWTGAREKLLFGPALACDPPPADALGGAVPGPTDDPRDHLRAVGWSRPDEGSPALALERRSEDYRTLEIWTWRAGELVRRHVERDPRWIGGPARRTRWEAGGEALLFGSEVAAGSTTPGRSQVFRVHLASGELRQVTAVAGEVKDFRPLRDGGLLVLASGDDPARTEYFYYDPDAARGIAGTAPRRYGLPPGVASDARPATDGARLFALHETRLRPAEVWAAELGPDARARTRTVPRAYDELAPEPPHRLLVVADDGTPLHAHVYLPPGVALDDAGPPRATVVFLHGAGYLQNVTDSMTRYPLNALFHVRLARMGYVVLDVDYRGSAGYGGRFRTDVQHHLGGRDLDDVHAVVDAMVARGLVDPRRVGVYGGSYGGFLTMMALFTAPERWAVGCALRSVTDWRTYHPGYTVPRLGRPSTHPAAYARSCPIDLVDGLADPLLVLHGMQDSNVFVQDSIRLIEALIDRGKDFDAMLYPSQEHAFEDGEHWLDEYRRIERFLIEHLGPPLLSEHGGARWQAVWVEGRHQPYPLPETPATTRTARSSAPSRSATTTMTKTATTMTKTMTTGSGSPRRAAFPASAAVAAAGTLTDRRACLGLGLGLGAGALAGCAGAAPDAEPAAAADARSALDERFADLTDQRGRFEPVTDAERARRRARLAELLAAHRVDALLVEPGATLTYLAGVSWGLSERLFGLVLCADGAALWVAPAFEEERARRHTASAPGEVVTWHEHEYAFRPLAAALARRGVERVAVEPRARLFVAEGLADAHGAERVVSGRGVVAALRGRKEPREIELLRAANELTQQAIAAVAERLSPGITDSELGRWMRHAQERLGLTGTWVLPLLNADAALPHGAATDRVLARGDLILVDTGGALFGYQSDNTRTWVFDAAPGERVTRVWNTVRDAQKRGFEALFPGLPCAGADRAARAAIAAGGFGDGYATFTHRLGHGIGLEGHEEPYLDGGNELALAPGMTFSDEPGIYLPGELGCRIEDIVCITDDGADHFGAWQRSPRSPA